MRQSEPDTPDTALRHFRRRNFHDFADHFDAWTRRVVSAQDEAEDRQGTDVPEPFAFGGISSKEASRRSAVEFDLVWDLARLCAEYINGELWGEAFRQRAGGNSVEQVLDDLGAVALSAKSDAYRRKWRAGLGVLGIAETSHRFNALARPSWADEAWSVWVDEGVTEFLDEDLTPALSNRRLVGQWTTSPESANVPAVPPNRERVNQFLQRFRSETGESIKKKEIPQLEGYRNGESEIKWFQSGDPQLSTTARAAIERVLSMPSSQVLQKLRKLRQRRTKKRTH